MDYVFARLLIKFRCPLLLNSLLIKVLYSAKTESNEVDRKLELVGRDFAGKTRQLRPRPLRVWRAWYAISYLLHIGRAYHRQMRVVAGHAVDLLAVQPEMLSVLSAVCRFIGDGRGEMRVFPDDVVAELRAIRGLLLVTRACLGRGPAPLAFW